MTPVFGNNQGGDSLFRGTCTVPVADTQPTPVTQSIKWPCLSGGVPNRPALFLRILVLPRRSTQSCSGGEKLPTNQRANLRCSSPDTMSWAMPVNDIQGAPSHLWSRHLCRKHRVTLSNGPNWADGGGWVVLFHVVASDLKVHVRPLKWRRFVPSTFCTAVFQRQELVFDGIQPR